MSLSHPSNNNYLPVRKPADMMTINIHEPDELRWWAAELGISMEKLLLLVLAYGEDASVIRKQAGRVNCDVTSNWAPVR